ncbi:hypothetical protein BU26DRAFT_601860 [Trematosphaeria pertusa]|uniref:Uncharacterized protein n=1 Tax=Trematosphaeria pertusa TaxID=390896 RepID=A0A6A6IX95_9PLEO|nr:uncharacterized protein BU26DRAFT_601860 [Trematosphaeria pertusa]KAF2253813.1 hypothetical protein BU26DRAFT_601860 [Trematosphaeria pertusa]
MSPTISSLLFHTAWRHLSFQATPWMIPRSSLDENGLIPRALFPEVYDQVKGIVDDLGEEAQYAAWFWVEGPQGEDGLHPAFSLPANR